MLCDSSSSCYTIAGIDKAINGTDLLTKTGDGYWQRDTDGLYLIKNYNNQYHSDKSIAEYAYGKTVDNLWYDGGSLTNGSMNWSNGNSTCQSRGWRLPTRDESNGKIIIDGGYSFAWTSTSSPLRDYWLHHPTNYGEEQFATASFVIFCVK